jgi:hypothetical protein
MNKKNFFLLILYITVNATGYTTGWDNTPPSTGAPSFLDNIGKILENVLDNAIGTAIGTANGVIHQTISKVGEKLNKKLSEKIQHPQPKSNQSQKQPSNITVQVAVQNTPTSATTQRSEKEGPRIIDLSDRDFWRAHNGSIMQSKIEQMHFANSPSYKLLIVSPLSVSNILCQDKSQSYSNFERKLPESCNKIDVLRAILPSSIPFSTLSTETINDLGKKDNQTKQTFDLIYLDLDGFSSSLNSINWNETNFIDNFFVLLKEDLDTKLKEKLHKQNSLIINSLGERGNTNYSRYNQNYDRLLGSRLSSHYDSYNMITVIPTTLTQKHEGTDRKTYQTNYPSMGAGLLPIIRAFKIIFPNLTTKEIAQIFVDTADKTIILKNGTNHTLICENRSKFNQYTVPIGTKIQEFEPAVYGAGFLDINEAFERATIVNSNRINNNQ